MYAKAPREILYKVQIIIILMLYCNIWHLCRRSANCLKMNHADTDLKPVGSKGGRGRARRVGWNRPPRDSDWPPLVSPPAGVRRY